MGPVFEGIKGERRNLAQQLIGFGESLTGAWAFRNGEYLRFRGI